MDRTILTIHCGYYISVTVYVFLTGNFHLYFIDIFLSEAGVYFIFPQKKCAVNTLRPRGKGRYDDETSVGDVLEVVLSER